MPWKIGFGYDIGTVDSEEVDEEVALPDLGIIGRLWYMSGVGGGVLMYQPHCGLSRPESDDLFSLT